MTLRNPGAAATPGSITVTVSADPAIATVTDEVAVLTGLGPYQETPHCGAPLGLTMQHTHRILILHGHV